MQQRQFDGAQQAGAVEGCLLQQRGVEWAVVEQCMQRWDVFGGRGDAGVGGMQAADVARRLQSVSDTCGPCDGPGVREVFFNNRKCYVVPPGHVDELMTRGQAGHGVQPRRRTVPG